MIITYYLTTFLLSLLLTIIYMFVWRKHYDVHITLIFALVPIIDLSYYMLYRSTTLKEALVGAKLRYLGGCYLQMIFALTVLSLCEIQVNRILKTLFMLASTAVYLSVLTIGESGLFYSGVALEARDGVFFLTRGYGPAHTAFYVLMIGYFAISLGAILYSFARKNQISRKILLLLFIPDIVAMLAYFGRSRLQAVIELIPAAFVFAQVVYLMIVRRISLYDMAGTAGETMVQSGDTGLITFDLNFCYLGSNQTARRILPELNELTVDRSLRRNRKLEELLSPWLIDFREHPEDTERARHFYEKDDRIYLFTPGWLTERNHHRGYQFVIRDDTLDRAYIKLLDDYNQDLQEEVAKKTAHIVEMHDNLVMSMATMVESRDNSTGGHIRRTSEGVRLLMEKLREREEPLSGYPLGKEFCRNLIKAAPMHDLGKIAVDDAVLRKPGRFTPEEFEKMKAHAPEGARIVHEILKHTDDVAFHHIAENVAHYHHERWDGSGYPDGLKGEEIPPEARIMAIADVYDALVSKRVYKEKMPFDKANSIIIEGMGTQFDPALEPIYQAARPELEAFYESLSE